MDASLPFDPKLIVTTETIPGFEVTASLGVAEGYEPFAAPAFTANGQRERFNDLLRAATLDMMYKAAAQGAQAIVGLRYLTIAETGMLVYGTAVTVRRISSDWNQAGMHSGIRV